MAGQQRGWFFVVDAGGGRLLQSIVVPPGRVHIEQRARLVRRKEGHERTRPSPLTGKAGNSYASVGHEAEEELFRFAREVAAWLQEKVRRFGIAHLDLFSPPRFLGAFRKVCGPQLFDRIETHQAGLMKLSDAGLAAHPAIEAVPPAEADGRARR